MNNAGVYETHGIEDYQEAILDRVWIINAKVPIALTHQVWPYLKESGQSRVIKMVSILGKLIGGISFGYNLTKHAMLAFTHSIRQAGWDLVSVVARFALVG